MRALIILASVLLWSLPVQASELDLGFNSDAFRVTFSRPVGSNSLEWDAGWLHHSDNGDAVHGGLYLTGDASSGSQPVRGGLGLRGVYTDGDRKNQEGLSFALGGFFRWAIPRYDRFAVSGHAYFSPEVLSMGDADKLQDYEIRVGYNVIQQADVYVGARYVRGDYEQAPNAYFDTGLNLGVELRF